MKDRLATIALAACAALLSLSTPAAAPETIVVKAAHLIDGRGGPPLEPAMVRISGEKIEEVAASIAVPAGATTIDLGAATLLPGLIDLHTHLTDREDVHWEAALTTTTPPEAALTYTSSISNSEHWVLDQSGYFPQVEQPEEYKRIVVHGLTR